jgi:hypothetical protein
MSYNRRRNPQSGGGTARILPIVLGGILFVVIIGAIFNSCSNQSSSITWPASSSGSSSAPDSSTAASANSVPWDYRLVEGTVGDLIGSDMTILPDNELLPNDDNYATGDKAWTMQYMSANMTANPDGRNTVTLSEWKAIKSFKTKEAAEKDINELKLSLKTEIDLVGVYKTEFQGKTRQFAVLTLPSGQQIKQPVDEQRYEQLKPLKKVNVILEEVHNYADYDMAYAKFRGWAS